MSNPPLIACENKKMTELHHLLNIMDKLVDEAMKIFSKPSNSEVVKTGSSPIAPPTDAKKSSTESEKKTGYASNEIDMQL